MGAAMSERTQVVICSAAPSRLVLLLDPCRCISSKLFEVELVVKKLRKA